MSVAVEGRRCEWCGKLFAGRADARFCSAAHRVAAHRAATSVKPRPKGSMDPKKRAGLEARLERLQLAAVDMSDVVHAAMGLRDQSQLIGPIRRVVVTGMFTTYARAFNESAGSAGGFGLPSAPTRGLSAKDRRIHEWAIKTERDQIWAHIDRSQDRRKTSVQEGAENVLALVEQYTLPSPDEIESLAELAGRLHDRYVAEAEKLAITLGLASPRAAAVSGEPQ